MEGLIMTAQLLLGLSILVGLHEFGHLIAAKIFGMRVEKFSIGFPPKIWGFQYGETEYSFGAIPLGGFVKISGIIDESLDTTTLDEEPQPWEFRAKPAWQRLIVMMGGIIVNVITGVFIYVTISYSTGETYLTKEELNKNGIVAYELGEQLGLKTGDRIIKINGKDYERYSDLRDPSEVFLGDNSFYTVDRNGQIFNVQIPDDFINDLTDGDGALPFINYRAPFVVSLVEPGSPADDGGLLEGDLITAINSNEIRFFDELKRNLSGNAGKKVSALISRDNDEVNLEFQVREEGTIGIHAEKIIALQTDQYTLGEAVTRGTQDAFGVVFVTIKGFGKMFSGDVDVRKSLAGPIRIAKMFGGTWVWLKFWTLTGLLSMVLAFMNFLPIPALDGGHVLFLTFEMISGRKPSDKFLEGAQKVGMVFLLGLMAFVIVNDIL